MTRLLSALAVLTLLSGAGHAQAPPPAAEQAPQLTMSLTSEGAEPRRELRYDLRAMQAQTTQMDMEMTVSMSLQGTTMDQAMPTMRTTLRVTDPTVTREGNLRAGVEVAEMSIVPAAGGDPLVEAQLAAALAQVGTFRGTLTMDARGNLVSSDFDLSSVGPAVREQMASMMQTMQQSVIPFPAEPVGVGARWSVEMAMEMNGISLRQVAAYEVVEISEALVRIATTIEQTANPQVLAIPDLPPGMSAELLSYAGSGSGGMTIRFDRTIPDGNFSIGNRMSMSTGDGMGNTVVMDMNLTMSATMTTVE